MYKQIFSTPKLSPRHPLTTQLKQIFFTHRTDVPWTTLNASLAAFQYQVLLVAKDGFCFLSALQQCLEHDHGMNISVSDIKILFIQKLMGITTVIDLCMKGIQSKCCLRLKLIC